MYWLRGGVAGTLARAEALDVEKKVTQWYCGQKGENRDERCAYNGHEPGL